MIIKFSAFGDSLGTRNLGEDIRNEIIHNFNNCEDKIIFDFENVDVICNSFADECFGKLVEEFGLNYVKSKTSFINTNEFINSVLKKAINDRLAVCRNTACV